MERECFMKQRRDRSVFYDLDRACLIEERESQRELSKCIVVCRFVERMMPMAVFVEGIVL